MAKATGAKTMAVECVTCLESYEKVAEENDIRVTDLVDLVHENTIMSESEKGQPDKNK